MLLKSQNKNQALKDLDTLANSRFDIPGDAGFPLNSVYMRPATPKDAEDMRNFIKQLRLETGIRVCAKVYENSDKPSKASYLLALIVVFGICFNFVFFSGGSALPKGDS